MGQKSVGIFFTMAALQSMALAGASGAWAQSGCLPAYEDRIQALTDKIDGIQGQFAVSGGSAAATAGALAGASVITTSLGIMTGAPIAGLLGYDLYLRFKRGGVDKAVELLSNAEHGDGRELRTAAKKLAKKHIHASFGDIAAAILRHDAQEDFCRPDWKGKPKLASVKQMIKIVQEDLR